MSHLGSMFLALGHFDAVADDGYGQAAGADEQAVVPAHHRDGTDPPQAPVDGHGLAPPGPAAVAAGEHRTDVADGVGVLPGGADGVETRISQCLGEADLLQRADGGVAVLYLPTAPGVGGVEDQAVDAHRPTLLNV